MTKLNFNRPLLRYLDNIRREMALDARRTDTLSFGVAKAPPAVPRGDSGIFPLTTEESTTVTEFFDAIERYIRNEGDVVNALASSSTRRSRLQSSQADRDASIDRLKQSAMAFAARMVLSGLDGRTNLLRLYKSMESGFAKECPGLWMVVNDDAMSEAMQRIGSLLGVGGCGELHSTLNDDEPERAP